MTKTSGSRSDGRKRTRAPGETVLAWMERWTSLVNVKETKIVEKQNGTSVANMMMMLPVMGPSCLACAAKTINIQNKKGHEKLSMEEEAKKSSSKKERTSDQGRGGVGCSCH